mgnify:CR=1 FL=1
MEEFNIGAQIKSVVESKGMSVTEFAKRINKSRENCYSIFLRKTIDTGLLQNISKVLQHDFFMQYSTSYKQMEEETQKLRDENILLKEYTTFLKKKDWWVIYTLIFFTQIAIKYTSEMPKNPRRIPWYWLKNSGNVDPMYK